MAERTSHKVRDAVREEREILQKTIGELHSNELELYLEALEYRYGLSRDAGFQRSDLMRFFQYMLNVLRVPGDGNFSAKDLQEFLKIPIAEAIELYTRLSMEGQLEDVSTCMRASNLLGFLYYVNHTMHSVHRAFSVTQTGGGIVPIESDNVPIVPGLAQFRILEPSETNDYQKLLIYLLNTAKNKGYRKYNGDCYAQKYNDQNQYTYAWERVCSIKDFVYDVTSKEFNFDIWKYLTAGKGNASSAMEYLGNCKDPEFPDLVKDRRIFSFSNGVYVAKHWDGRRFVDVFWPYDAPGKLPQHVVACKYFDIPFDNHDSVADWYDIPTPHLQSIMDFQEWEESVCRWMYIFIGRLIYEVGELDCWQVIPFLKGTAGSGKSTIALKVCGNIFEKSDVGILSNNIERKFGISAFSDKYMFVAPEIKSDLQMEQAEFQSIVSGEDIQVNVKFQKARAIEWKVPGLLAGNEVPAWADNSGSISRRCIIFDFHKQVRNGDMELARKLERELAAIIKKCNRAYLETVAKYSRDNVWNHLPDYFRSTRADLEEATNSLEHFLNSEKVVLEPTAYCKYEEFIQMYKAHVKEFNFPKVKINKDFLRTPFSKRSIHVSMETRDGLKTYYVFGARLAFVVNGMADDY